MTSAHSISGHLTRRPNVSALIYVALVVVCCLTTLFAITDLVERYRVRNASFETLSRLEGRDQISSKDVGPRGSPFLEGQTLTTAGATLLQRITSIISNAGGTVVSSEMVQRGAQIKDGYVTAIANCELEQETLQKVLYEIEAGLPFLFIDQLQVQTPLEGQSGRLRVVLGVTGLWTGTK